MAIYSSADRLIGRTPLLELCNLEKELGLVARLVAKLEMLNPAGSVKDRAACAMIEAAEASGRLKAGATIIEPTSGNTGIGLCSVAAARGYQAIIVMPDSMSPERIKLMKAYGAQVVLTPGHLGMKGAIAKANEIAEVTESGWIAGQFENPANAMAHFETTAPEIFADTDGEVDVFVAGIGTGGTVTGVGRYLKSRNPQIEIVGVEPSDSAVLSGGVAGTHKLQGIGAGFVPEVLDPSVLDRVMQVTTEEAYAAGRLMGRREGILVGISGGAALAAAIELAKEPERKGQTIVVLLPDGGDRYLSTEMYTEDV